MTLTKPPLHKQREYELHAHEQQRARVLASLLAVPGRAKPMHRRWAQNPSAAHR